jgi:hypothetical protein
MSYETTRPLAALFPPSPPPPIIFFLSDKIERGIAYRPRRPLEAEIESEARDRSPIKTNFCMRGGV